MGAKNLHLFGNVAGVGAVGRSAGAHNYQRLGRKVNVFLSSTVSRAIAL